MAKAKSHKGISKRVKITGTGKVLYRHCGARKLLSKKSAKRKRHLARPAVLTGQTARKLKMLASS